MKYPVSLFFKCILLIAVPYMHANAEELDLSKELKKITFRESPVISWAPDRTFGCREDGTFTHAFLMRIALCELSFDDIKIISVDVVYSDPVPAAIPETIKEEVYNYENCNDAPLSISDSISLTTREGTTFTKKTQISEGSSITSKFGISIPIKAISFDMSREQVVNFSRTDAEEHSTDYTVENRFTQNISIVVPPSSVYQVKLKRIISNAYIAVRGSAIIDANITARARHYGRDDYLNGVMPMGRVGDWVNDDNNKIIYLEGELWNARGSSVTRTDNVSKLDSNSPVCQNSRRSIGNFSAHAELGKMGDTSFSSNFLTALSDDSSLATLLVPSIESLNEETVIETDDVVANVYVRAVSTGPSFCGVSVDSPNEIVSFMAPPYSYSSWMYLYSHLGSSSESINPEYYCPGGANFEVKFHKRQ